MKKRSTIEIVSGGKIYPERPGSSPRKPQTNSKKESQPDKKKRNKQHPLSAYFSKMNQHKEKNPVLKEFNSKQPNSKDQYKKVVEDLLAKAKELLGGREEDQLKEDTFGPLKSNKSYSLSQKQIAKS